MQKTLAVALALVPILLTGRPAEGAKLGDPAPPLSVKEWVKGDAVRLEALKGKRAAVIEFWATWCPPCRTSIPHLTELQQKYKDAVVIVGISDEEASAVKPFVERMGDKMKYTIAIDDKHKTNDAYMGAFGLSGIPTAFIVDKSGAVVFHGHPMDPHFEEILHKVVDRTFDFAAYQAELAKSERAKQHILEYFRAMESGLDAGQAQEAGKKLYESIADLPDALGYVAYVIAANSNLPHRDLDLAKRMVEQAAHITKGESGFVLHAHARVLFAQGRMDDAVKMQRRAVELAQSDGERTEMESQLKEFEEAAGRKS